MLLFCCLLFQKCGFNMVEVLPLFVDFFPKKKLISYYDLIGPKWWFLCVVLYSSSRNWDDLLHKKVQDNYILHYTSLKKIFSLQFTLTKQREMPIRLNTFTKNFKRTFLFQLEGNTDLFTTGHISEESFLLQPFFWVWEKYNIIIFFPDLLENLLVFS